MATITRGRYEHLAGRAKLLSWLSQAWMTGAAVKEGTEAWRGEGCCVSSPLDGVGFTAQSTGHDGRENR